MDLLIPAIKERPALWDRRNKLYKMKASVEKSWEEVAEITGFEKEEAKVKWRNLRDNFLKELKKAPKRNADGTFQYKGKWRYFNPMSFLLEIHLPTLLGEDPNSSNMEIEPYLLGEIISDAEAENSFIDKEKNSTEPENLRMESIGKRRKIKENDISSPAKTLELGEIVLDGHPAGDVDRHSAVAEDPDLSFIKSLVPFFKKLSDLQKLHVRNQFQNILIRQLSTVAPELDANEME